MIVLILLVGVISFLSCNKETKQPDNIKPTEPLPIQKIGKELLEPIYNEIDSPDNTLKNNK